MRVPEFFTTFLFKKILIIFLTVLLVGAIVYTALRNYQESGSILGDSLEISFVDDQKEKELDTDGDGVSDREEKILGLDPTKIDSDDDGVTDGMYVRYMRAQEEQRILGVGGDLSNLSETEKLGRMLMTAVLAIEQTGGTVDANTQEVMSDNIVDYMNTLTIGDRLYVKGSLTTVSDTKENVYNYRDKFNSLLITYSINDTDITLLAEALGKGNEPYRSSLEQKGIKYDSLAGELAMMEVPLIIAGKHTTFLNNVNSLAGALKNLSMEEPDEVVMMATLAQLQGILENLTASLEKINLFFEIVADESVFEA